MDKTYPANWLPEGDFVPQFMLLKGKQYLVVAERIAWFLRDQRFFMANGMATGPYTIETGDVRLDLERGYAYYEVSVTDVFGNQVVANGSETAKDFPDYAEKAYTKALGRAVALLGYSTGAAQDFDETNTNSGEPRIVDAPRPVKDTPSTDEPATEKQVALVTRLYPDMDITGLSKRKAGQLIAQKNNAA